jgi:hypothetical protein
MHKALVAFYTDAGTDDSNRSHPEILAFTDKELEMCHDFIQWVFPTERASAFNKDAPLLDRSTVNALKDDLIFQTRFSLTLKRMFKFWGLGFTGSGKAIRVLPIKKELHWMQHDNHNLLRMSRLMESCRLLGFEGVGQSLFAALINSIKDLNAKNDPWQRLESSFITLENVYWWRLSAYGN